MSRQTILVFIMCICCFALSGCFLWDNDEAFESPTGPLEESLSGDLALSVRENQRPDHYIITLKKDVSDIDSAVAQLEKQHGFKTENRYHFALKGFSAAIPQGKLDSLKSDPLVETVEPDVIVTKCAQVLPWGINKIDADLSPTALANNGSGEVLGPKIYVIDTGIQLTHPDLNVMGGIDFTGTNGTGDDGDGHGTHVAGIIAAKDNDGFVVGVAPGAELYAVKVLDNTGSGYLSWVISGVDYVTQQKLTNPGVAMAANMSLGFKTTTAYNSADIAVKNSILSGVVYSVAAGNSKIDAKFFSPAHVVEAITVGAYDSRNVFASFSNYGTLLDVNSPGVSILSTYKNSTTATLSGTSMAAPHVTGAAALLLANNPMMTPQEVRDRIVSAGQPWVSVKKSGTTKLSVYVKTF